MRKTLFTITIIVISSIMIAGCSSTATPLPPTATPLPPTATPLPPTATPTATPTKTPTATPTATEVLAISDIEFAEKAQDTCNELLQELRQIARDDPNDIIAASKAWFQAAEALGKLDFTAQSSPLGYQLQTNMAKFAEVLEPFNSAYQQALAEAGINKTEFYVTFEDGSIFVLVPNSGLKQLNIDKELSKQFFYSRDAIIEAATELKLEECAPSKSDLID